MVIFFKDKPIKSSLSFSTLNRILEDENPNLFPIFPKSFTLRIIFIFVTNKRFEFFDFF